MLLDADHSMNSSFVAGFRPMRFVDGWGIVTPTSDADFAGMCRALDVAGYDDPRVATVGERRKHREVMEPIMDMVYAQASNLTQAEATARLEAERGPFAMILSPAQLTRDEHAGANGQLGEDAPPDVGPPLLPRHPTRFGRTPA